MYKVGDKFKDSEAEYYYEIIGIAVDAQPTFITRRYDRFGAFNVLNDCTSHFEFYIDTMWIKISAFPWEKSGVHKCTCDSRDLLWHGCRCGGK